MNSAMVAWIKSDLRHNEKLIREANISQETREKALGYLVKLAYCLLEATS